jgi:thiol-disulfide isomerase/thioredoxin
MLEYYMRRISLDGIEINVGSRPNVASGRGSCLKEVRLPKDLNREVKNRDNTVMFLHSHNCGHCKQTIPLIEQKCREAHNAGKNIGFVSCAVENPFCSEVLSKVKSDGVPTTIMMEKDGSVKNSKWKVIGADLENLDKKINKMINGGKSKKGSKKKEQSQQQTQSREQQTQRVRFGAPEATQGIIENILQPIPRSVSFDDVPELCIPGRDENCYGDDFTDSISDWLSF